MEILLTLALFAPLVWLMERTHRRARDLPRVRFGAAAESEYARLYRRQMAELRALSDQLEYSEKEVVQARCEAEAPAIRTPAASARLTPLTRLQRTLGAGFSPLGGWSGTASMVKHC
ncbi:MAG: hypothetical protein IPL41_10685 [Micropruina sp.]|nr:hypothetical protein [Micropruina sp.]